MIKRKLAILCVALHIAMHTVTAATYFVATSGSDSNPGSQDLPWGTVQKAASTAIAGDRVIIAPGDYPEAVKTQSPGTAANQIVVDGQGAANIHRLVVSQPHWRIQNLRVSGYTNSWFHGLIDIEAGAHSTVLSNCYIKPTIQYLGGIEFDSGKVDPFDDTAPSNCLIISNVITGVIGRQALSLFGTNNLFVNNTVTNLYKADFVRLWGRWNIIGGNTFSNMLDHAVSNHPDFIQTFGQNGDGSKGHVIEGNLVSDIPNGQLAQLTRSDGVSDPLGDTPEEMGDWTFRNNIFRNIALQSSCSIPGTKWYNNVFYRCNYLGGHALVFGHGGRGTADGFRIYNNAFIDCGKPGSFNSGWYASVRPDGTAWSDAEFNWNFVAKADFQAVQSQNPPSAFRWYEPNGINGGDPMFLSLSSLDFRLRAGSPLRDKGKNVAEVRIDFSGVPRPQYGTTDIGPFEFIEGVAPASPSGLRLIKVP